jgi:hypothetical protein
VFYKNSLQGGVIPFHEMKECVWGTNVTVAHIPNLRPRCRRVVNIMFQPIYPWKYNPSFHIIRAWVGRIARLYALSVLGIALSIIQS